MTAIGPSSYPIPVRTKAPTDTNHCKNPQAVEYAQHELNRARQVPDADFCGRLESLQDAQKYIQQAIAAECDKPTEVLVKRRDLENLVGLLSAMVEPTGGIARPLLGRADLPADILRKNPSSVYRALCLALGIDEFTAGYPDKAEVEAMVETGAGMPSVIKAIEQRKRDMHARRRGEDVPDRFVGPKCLAERIEEQKALMARERGEA